MCFQCMLVWLKIFAPPEWMIGKLIMAKSLVFLIACEMLILYLRYTELDSLHHQEPKPMSPMTNEEEPPMDDEMPETEDNGWCRALFGQCLTCMPSCWRMRGSWRWKQLPIQLSMINCTQVLSMCVRFAESQILALSMYTAPSSLKTTVDGRNPKQPPGMYETL